MWRGADIDSIRRARAQFSGFPRRYTVIRYRTATDRRMYVRRTRKSDGDHDYVGLAQARPNYVVTTLLSLLNVFACSLAAGCVRVVQDYDSDTAA